MSAALDFITAAEDTLAHGSSRQHSEMLRRVTDLFVIGAARCSDGEIALFDDVLARLSAKIETSARALLSARLAPIENAPPRIIKALALDDVIDVAGPVLTQSSRLDDATLIEVANKSSQEHLFAISRRSSLSVAVTDILVERGDHQVALSTVENLGAKISDAGFAILVKRSEGDDRFTSSVGSRTEIPPQLFIKLLAMASENARARLETALPELKLRVHQAVAQATRDVHAEQIEESPSYAAAQALVEPLHRSGRLDERQLATFANTGQFENVVAGLAVFSRLSLQFVEHTILQDRSDTLLILSKAVGLSWPTVKALLLLRVARHVGSATEISRLMASYERLRVSTAQEIIQFYRKRDGTERQQDH